MANVVEERKFTCVKGLKAEDANHNKFWNIKRFDNDDVEVTFGRVGQAGSSKVHKGGGISKFESLIREKTNPNRESPYRENKTIESKSDDSRPSTVRTSANNSSLLNIALSQIKTNNPIVAKLIKELTDQNIHDIVGRSGGKITYDASTAQFKTPQGVIEPGQISEARQLLSQLSNAVQRGRWMDTDLNYLTDYLYLIPHSLGMKRITPESVFPNGQQSFMEENDLLDGLEASFNDIVSGKGKNDTATKTCTLPQVFSVDLHLVDDGKIIDQVRNKYRTSRKDSHVCKHLDVKTVYTITIKNMFDAFSLGGKPVGNIMQLWHGTKTPNVLSIMKKGLIIPPSNAGYCTGRMFGNGVYFASASTKSLNYAYGYWDNTRNERCFMFLADVAMGKYYVPASSGEHLPKLGFHSTWAKCSHSGVQNDEMIVYNTNQCNLVYLIEFTPGGK